MALKNGNERSFGALLRLPEFRAIWLADGQSALGDQLARVALSILVWDRTGSTSLTALTYALTFLPAVFGAALLSSLADRASRRTVMVVCDVLRAGLLAVMAVPGLPLPVVAVLLVAAVLLGTPFTAAESALVAQILPAEDYAAGIGLRTITSQVAQLAGFALGGVAVAALGASSSLLLDAATFVVSALLIRFGVRARPSAHATTGSGDRDPVGYLSTILDGTRAILQNRELRILLGLAWLVGFFVVPEGLASPVGLSIGAGPRGVGILLAAAPAGAAVGLYFFVNRLSEASRARLMGPLAIGAGLAIAGTALTSSFIVTAVLWLISGALASYHVQVVAEFVRRVPDARRGHAVGVASGGLVAVQGIGIYLAGLLAGITGARTAVGVAGLVGAVCAVALALRWRQRGGASMERQDEMTVDARP